MPNSVARSKKDPALRNQWGIIGILLAILLAGWYLYSSGRLGVEEDPEKKEWLKNYVKIVCPRCNKNPDLQKNCSLCNGLGYIWVDKTKDFPEEVIIP